MLRKEMLSRYPELRDPNSHPRFTGIPWFTRAPVVEDFASVDIAMIGVPYDGGAVSIKCRVDT